MSGQFMDVFEDPILVGTGTFGVVVSATNNMDNERRGIKLVASLDPSVRKEVETLSMIGMEHENIIRFYKSWTIDLPSMSEDWQRIMSSLSRTTETVFTAIELELCQSKQSVQTINIFFNELFLTADLKVYLAKRNELPMDTAPLVMHQSLINCIRDVSNGLKFLHDRRPPTVHRDLKPANILCHQNGTWKIGDLGLARLVDSSMTPHVGSPCYLAPEQGMTNYGEKVDIFAFGLVLVEITHRMRDKDHHYQCFRGIRSRRFEYPPHSTERFDCFPPSLDDLIGSMLVEDPKYRISINTVIHRLDNHIFNSESLYVDCEHSTDRVRSNAIYSHEVKNYKEKQE